MPKVTILRGFSGSGKSTWAKQSGAFIVSRDRIRSQITGNDQKTALSNEGENLVSKLEQAQIETALKAGVNVVVDNTNLRARDARKYIDLAVKHGVEWDVQDFPTPRDECLERNANRGVAWVPPSVIETQARKFPIGRWPVLGPSVDALPAWEQYVPDTTLPDAWVFDIDGTLAQLPDGFSPYDHLHYPHDTPIDAVRHALNRADTFGDFVVLLSGRGAEHREATEAWLSKHGIGFDVLHMRAEGDKRNDAIIKSELFDAQVAPYFNVLGVYDDRLRVCRMWHARGIPLFRVGDPDADF